MQYNFFSLHPKQNSKLYKSLEILTFELPETLGLSGFKKIRLKVV